jgi:hypothetical protein
LLDKEQGSMMVKQCLCWWWHLISEHRPSCLKFDVSSAHQCPAYDHQQLLSPGMPQPAKLSFTISNNIMMISNKCCHHSHTLEPAKQMMEQETHLLHSAACN